MTNQEIQELIIKTNFDEVTKADKAYSALINKITQADLAQMKASDNAKRAAVANAAMMRIKFQNYDKLSKAAEAAYGIPSQGVNGSSGSNSGSNAKDKPASIIPDYTKELNKQMMAVEKDLFHNFDTGARDLKNLMSTLKIGSDTFVGSLVGGLVEAESVFKDIVGVINSISSIGKDLGILSDVVGLLGFASGGYTGPGNPKKLAGFVHKGEYVFDADTTSKFFSVMDSLHKGTFDITKDLPGITSITHSNYNYISNLPNPISALNTPAIRNYEPTRSQPAPIHVHLNVSSNIGAKAAVDILKKGYAGHQIYLNGKKV